MSQPGGRTASLGRNPSADYMKRRKSWQTQDKPYRLEDAQDVRTMLSPQKLHLPHRRAEVTCTCAEGTFLQSLVIVVGVLALACLILLVMAISFKSNLVYSKWIVARDGTVYYVNNMDRLQAVLLVSVFCATALGIIASYALFTLVSRRLAERTAKQRHAELYGDMVLGDIERGAPQHQTKENIQKLMSEAEKQYIAEYNKKMGPDDSKKPASATPAGQPNVISIQRLTEGAPVSSTGRSWSLKRVLSFSKKPEQSYSRADLRPKDLPQDFRLPEWAADPNEMAAKLSSPDAFNRAGIAQRPNSGQSLGQGSQKEDPVPPGTPQRQEHLIPSDSQDSPSQTRIMVTTPVESLAKAPSKEDSEEEEYDKGRQHSILPHLAGQHPFQAEIMESGDFGPGWHEVQLEGDEDSSKGQGSGHLIAQHSTQPSATSVESADSCDLVPEGHMNLQQENARGRLDLTLEEVLPRPQTGLLNRLLRLAKVETYKEGDHTVFILQPGKEYMINFKLQMNEEQSMRLVLKWIRIKPPDGQAVRFNVEEETKKERQWTGSACWDLCLHNSEILSSDRAGGSQSPSTVKIAMWAETNDQSMKRLKLEGELFVSMQQAAQRQPTTPTRSPRLLGQNMASFLIL